MSLVRWTENAGSRESCFSLGPQRYLREWILQLDESDLLSRKPPSWENHRSSDTRIRRGLLPSARQSTRDNVAAALAHSPSTAIFPRAFFKTPSARRIPRRRGRRHRGGNVAVLPTSFYYTSPLWPLATDHWPPTATPSRHLSPIWRPTAHLRSRRRPGRC